MKSIRNIVRVLARSFSFVLIVSAVALTGVSTVRAQDCDVFGFDSEGSAEADPFGEDCGFCGDESDPFGGSGPFGEDDEFDLFGDDDVEVRSQFVTQDMQAKRNRSKVKLIDRMRKLGYYGIGDETEAEVSILERLDRKATLSVDEEPLGLVVRTISKRYEIPVVLDRHALMTDENVDFGSDPVSVEVANIKLKNAMKLMLNGLGLAVLVKDEVLMITSKSVVEETLTTKVYRIQDNWEFDEDDFVDTILRMVHPDSWEAAGGAGALKAVKGGVFVSNSAGVHAEIEKLCAKFAILYE